MNASDFRVEFSFDYKSYDVFELYEKLFLQSFIFRGANAGSRPNICGNIISYINNGVSVEIEDFVRRDNYLGDLEGQRICKVSAQSDFIDIISNSLNFDSTQLSFSVNWATYNIFERKTGKAVYLYDRPSADKLVGMLSPEIATLLLKSKFVCDKYNGEIFRFAYTSIKYFSQEISNIVRSSKKTVDGDLYLVPSIERVRKYLKGQGIFNDYPYIFCDSEVKKLTEMEIAEIAVRSALRVPETIIADGTEFEKEVAKRLLANGWSAKLTKATGDFGVDIIAEKNEISVAIQVKSGLTKTGIAAIQQAFAGAKHYNTDYAAVISNSEFTQAAIDLSLKTSVSLFRGDQIDEFDGILR